MKPDNASRADCRVSVLVFTFNEEANLNHCLCSLDWCDDVVVVDSFSTDGTIKICEGRDIRAVQNLFTGFGDQRNWALNEIPLKHDWILILDADERVPQDLAAELNRLAETSRDHIAAYRLKRRFYLWGRWLRYSSLYPTWVVRFVRRGRVRYVNRGHSETQKIGGDIVAANGYLIDENHKDLEAWFRRQSRYSQQEAIFEINSEDSAVSWMGLISTDPLGRRAVFKRFASRLPFRGALYFLYCYLIRLGFLDGKNGFVFCRMKAVYQSMIAINKYDLRKKCSAGENRCGRDVER